MGTVPADAVFSPDSWGYVSQNGNNVKNGTPDRSKWKMH